MPASVLILLSVLALVTVVAYLVPRLSREQVEVFVAQEEPATQQPADPDEVHGKKLYTEFPVIPEGLSEKRQTILALSKQEFENPQEATVYSEGAIEPWCADLVSWIFREAGYPFENPNSGSWRIPGTMTLLDYFRSTGEWVEYDPEVRPEPGDVPIYDTLSFFGQHTNIVVAIDGDEVITLDGNSAKTIRLRGYHWDDEKARVLGFARID